MSNLSISEKSVALLFDPLAIRNHVELLHKTATGLDGKFIVSVFNGDSAGIITHHRVGEVEGMIDAICAQSAVPGANVYTGLHLMRSDLPRGKRGGKGDITVVLGLVADMDADTGKLGTMPVTPSLVIESSPGNTQPVILFDHAVAPEKAETLAKALQIATASDSGTGDIAHVWRIPGTLNYPNAAKLARGRSVEPANVCLLEPFLGEVHSIDALIAILVPFIVENGATIEQSIFTAGVDTPPLWERMPDPARLLLLADGQPDRSKHAARVVEHLHFADFTLNETVSLIMERPGKWTDRYKDIAELVKDVERCWAKFAVPKDAAVLANAQAVEQLLYDNDNGAPTREATGTASSNLPVIDPRDWQGKPVPERKWFVEGWIPDRTVTNLSGDGGSGKTEIILQMIAASSLETQWFGKAVSMGPCLYYGAEDEADELHRRLETIVQCAGRQLSDLDGIRLIPMAGLDAVLAEPDQKKNLAATTIFPKLVSQAKALRPKLIVIDPSADVFGGDEINRAQVRKFVSMLRALAMDIDCAVLLLSHPSLTGMSSGTGTSGSTAWNNSVRSRLYLEIASPDTRVLKLVKANHGKVGAKIEMRWHDGIYVLDDGDDPIAQSLVNSSIDKLFLELLALFTAQGQNLGIVTGTNYAPSKMALHPKGKGFTKKQLAASMQRLLDSERIKVVTEGSPSRQRSRLVVTDKATIH